MKQISFQHTPNKFPKNASSHVFLMTTDEIATDNPFKEKFNFLLTFKDMKCNICSKAKKIK